LTAETKNIIASMDPARKVVPKTIVQGHVDSALPFLSVKTTPKAHYSRRTARDIIIKSLH